MFAFKVTVSAIIALIVTLFLYNNGQMVELNFWPFSYVLTVSLSILLICVLVFGIFIGGLSVWVNQVSKRLRARKKAKMIVEESNDIHIEKS